MGREMETPENVKDNNLDSQTFLTGDNALYVAGVYARYLADRTSVDQSWQNYFAGMSDDMRDVLMDLTGPSWGNKRSGGVAQSSALYEPITRTTPAEGTASSKEAILDSIRAIMLVRAHRSLGHLVADLDPLKLNNRPIPSELEPSYYGFGPEDMDRPIFMDNVLGLEYASIREVMEVLRRNYCGKIGIEFLHIQDGRKKQWLQQRIEGNAKSLNEISDPISQKGMQAQIFQDLTASESFEKFLHVKYPAAKRFGLDGGESLIPGLEQALCRSAELGVQEVVLGMAHRGRLNVLANIMGKPYRAIFSEFQGGSANPDNVQGSGDVKYHLGTSTDRIFSGRQVHLSLTANPSHLEAVDPVVVGKVRAKQAQLKDSDRSMVMGVLLHGDAAFAGQGLVAETLALSELVGYETGGTFHIIINNQIGFTTSPEYSRSTAHCSDWAKAVQAPVFHVNGDCVESVVKVMNLAAEYRQEFKSDVVVDLVCYRRYGHNEADEPMFTQPVMYKVIKSHPTIQNIYRGDLLSRGALTEDDLGAIENTVKNRLDGEFEESKTYKPEKADWLEGKWAGLKSAEEMEAEPETGVSEMMLKEVGKNITDIPAEFHLNSKLKRFFDSRMNAIEAGKDIDWATGEALAFATLLQDGIKVRLSGQDCGRGTFTQRHAILKDQEDGSVFMPISRVSGRKATLEVWDSPLAEASVLGFEMGYTLAEPNALVMWEAQFGDFSNGAQVIIDQFVSSGESKWLRMSGLVMLLPHGYEGQGPEHSSARLERYLQLCAENNMQVINPTTPASYFHALRRQVKRSYRKPLVVMTPKSLLRHKLAVSELKEFGSDSRFMRILPERFKLVADKSIRRVLLCTGKIYYDLLEARVENKIDDIAIISLEQLYPFPAIDLEQELQRYPNADVVWVQEEPKNMGAWHFVDRKLEPILHKTKIKQERPICIGRMEAASPATGLMSRHVFEQKLLVSQALKLI